MFPPNQAANPFDIQELARLELATAPNLRRSLHDQSIERSKSGEEPVAAKR